MNKEQALIDYIKKARAAGQKDEQIVDDLFKAGWSNQEIQPFLIGKQVEILKSGKNYSSGKKFGDFLLGFFGLTILGYLFFGAGQLLPYEFMSFVPILGFIIFIIGIIYAARTGRKYVAVGMVSVFIIPALAFGACILALSGV